MTAIMVRSKWSVVVFLMFVIFSNCRTADKKRESFDEMNKTVQLGNWKFDLNVENQNKKKGAAVAGIKEHYLKATLFLSNSKTKKSLLYSISDDIEDYEEKYKYLSFGSKDDLYIKCKEEYIYPIGYVFEPSNGLSNTDRLVYKFQINDDLYKRLIRDNVDIEYWYIDKLTGLGKICFK